MYTACKPATSIPHIQISLAVIKYVPSPPLHLIIDSQVVHQALTIISERMNANKPPTSAPDPKSGKLAPGQINNNKDLDVDSKKEEPSFFGSFFAGKKTATKKGVSTMEAVRPELSAFVV
jgi:hypothetical protein